MEQVAWTSYLKTYLSNLMTDTTTSKHTHLIESLSQESAHSKVLSLIVKTVLDEIKGVQIDTLVGGDVYRDVEFFHNINEEYLKTSTVFDVIDHHATLGGKEATKRLLSSPMKNVKLLKDRQAIMQEFETKATGSDIVNLLETVKEHERDVLWLYSDIDKNLEDIYNIVYFKMSFLQTLNKSGHVLTGWNLYKIIISPLIGILSPLVYFIIPYFVVMYKFPQLKMSLTTYLKFMYQMVMNQDLLLGDFGKYRSVRILSYMFSLLFYFQGIFNSVEISKTLYKMSGYLINKVNNVIKFLKASKELIHICWNPKVIGNILQSDLVLLPNDEECKYIDALRVKDFSLLGNFGENLKVYKTINKEVITSILCKTYVIDSLLSIIKFKNINKLCFTTYIDKSKTPSIRIEGLWHPCLQQDVVIKNDFVLGTNDTPQNAIITGPNAGGKSTCVKSFLINIILSQTICISSCSFCELTPVHYINSQISVPDCKGHESLFQAELYRCKNNLDALCSLKPTEFAFITMDEIFNSTNVIEGIAGAYAIAKKMASYDNLMMIFTTHFSYLTKLSKMTKKFENLKMNVEIDPESKQIRFPYKLSKGISKQYIALELLKQKGFDADILEEAIRIKDKFV